MKKIYGNQKIYNVGIENTERTGIVNITCQIDPNNSERYIIIAEISEGTKYMKAIRRTIEYINHLEEARLFSVDEFGTISAAYMYLLHEISEEVQLFGKTLNSPMYKI